MILEIKTVKRGFKLFEKRNENLKTTCFDVSTTILSAGHTAKTQNLENNHIQNDVWP